MQKYAVVEMIYFINRGCVIFWKNMFLKIDFKRAKYILTKSGEYMCAMLCSVFLRPSTNAICTRRFGNRTRGIDF